MGCRGVSIENGSKSRDAEAVGGRRVQLARG